MKALLQGCASRTDSKVSACWMPLEGKWSGHQQLKMAEPIALDLDIHFDRNILFRCISHCFIPSEIFQLNETIGIEERKRCDMKLNFLIANFITFLSLITIQSQASNLISGEYLAKSGAGTLLITPRNGAHYFKINAYGGNGHSCFVEGLIKENINQQLDQSGQVECTIIFKPMEKSIDVTTNQDLNCQSYCGARARFSQEYFATDEICQSRNKQKELNIFKRHYNKKSYVLAEKTIRKLYDTCSPFLRIFEKMNIVNDLAVTYKNLQNKSECLNILKPFEELASLDDSQIKAGFPPADAKLTLPIAKRLKFNLQICRELKN